MGVTIKQIADRANVSRGTVDRVIHGRYGVDPEIRSRVLAIMEELDYKPNAMARALKGSNNPIRLGAIVPNCHNPFYIDIHAGIDEAGRNFADYGVQVIKLEMHRASTQCQIECIDELEKLGVRGIMLVPIDHPDVRDRLNRLPESIPVITYNSDIAGTKRLCFVGNDHIAAGRVAGRLMSQLVQKGKMGLLISQSDLLAHVERVEGFCAVLGEACPQIEWVGPYFTYEEEWAAYQIVRELLNTYPDLTGIYVAGGGQQRASRALAESDRVGSVHMICHDLLPETVQHVRQGIVDFTLGQEAFVQGYMPVELMYEYHMFAREPRYKKLYTRIDIRVRDNVEQKGFEVFTGPGTR